MSYIGGLKNIEILIAFFEQQRGVTAADVLLLRSWCDLDLKGREAPQK
jgi:hypothetical protein